MIPILYEANETEYRSNGIGRLTDSLRCEVTEERNGIFELELDYPVSGQHYSDILEGRIIAAVHDDNKDVQPFDIYGRTAPIDGIVTFYAHHVSYRLQYSILRPFTASSVSEAFSMLAARCVTPCPFTFWTDKSTAGSFAVSAPISVKEILGGVEGSVLDVFGKGEYEWDRFRVKLYLNRGADTGVQIRYGKNLIDLTQDVDTSGYYSAVVPYWKGTDGTLVTLSEWVINSSAASAGNVPVKAVPLDLSDQWETAPTEAQLRAAAQKRMEDAEAWLPDENIKVDFAALWQTEEYASVAPLEQVKLCDRVDVIHPELGVTARGVQVIKVVYDALLERYSSMELGTARTSFAEVVKAAAESSILPQVPTKSFLQTVIEELSAEINAGAGGIIVDVNDANGNRSEILILCDEGVTVDTPPEQCQHIWRINKAGIGYSSDYGRTYTLAITASGQIVADFITTGLLRANIIKAGVLSDANGLNYWNMETGDFQLTSTATVGGKTVAELIDESMPELTQEEVFNILTNNGAMQGIFMRNGTLYINGSYIYGGTLVLGGRNNQNGVMSVRDSYNDECVSVDKDGITVANGTTRDRYHKNAQSNMNANGLYNQCDYYSSYTDQTLPLTSGVQGGEFFFTIRHGGSNETFRMECVTSNEVGSKPYVGFSSELPIVVAKNGAYGFGGTNGLEKSSTRWGYTFNVQGGLWANSLTVTGTKSREADTDHYNRRLLYCYEMSAPLFGDVGNGTLDENGECFIEVDDIFSETARTDIAYQVFLQKEGKGDVYVVEKTARYFVVRGTPNLSFAWELKAKQAGFENHRLDEPDLYFEETDNGLLDSIYDNELDSMYRELEVLYETA